MAPLVCDKCGSEWFNEVSLKKYAASTYSSAGGGDLAMISTTEQAIRVCARGRAIPPSISGGRRGVGPEEMRAVVTAVDKARTMHDEAEKTLTALAHEALTAKQLDDLVKEIGVLATRVATLEESNSHKSKQTPAKEKTTSAESKQ